MYPRRNPSPRMMVSTRGNRCGMPWNSLPGGFFPGIPEVVPFMSVSGESLGTDTDPVILSVRHDVQVIEGKAYRQLVEIAASGSLLVNTEQSLSTVRICPSGISTTASIPA